MQQELVTPPVDIGYLDSLAGNFKPKFNEDGVAGLYYNVNPADEKITARVFKHAAVDEFQSKQMYKPVLGETLVIMLEWKDNNKKTVKSPTLINESNERYWRERFPKAFKEYESGGTPETKIPGIDALSLTVLEHKTLEAYGYKTVADVVNTDEELARKVGLERWSVIKTQAQGYMDVLRNLGTQVEKETATKNKKSH